jgi:NADH-quinone oxidoreductase subunit J
MDANAIVSLIISNAVFFFLAIVIIVFAFLMVSARNLVHSALFMVAVFIGIAGIYAMLSADFLAVAQVMVYVGAISVLLIFGVMLTRRADMTSSNPGNNHRLGAFIISFGLFAVLTWKVLATQWATTSAPPAESTVGQIADLLLGKYVVPFEAAAVLLLAAMAGAIILGKGADLTK